MSDWLIWSVLLFLPFAVGMASAMYPQNTDWDMGTASTANSNTDGTTGSYGTISTGTASGNKEITRVEITGFGTLTAGFVRLFAHNGTTAYMLREIPVPPWTPRVAQPAVSNWKSPSIIFDPPLALDSTSDTLKMSTENSETFRAIAYFKEYV